MTRPFDAVKDISKAKEIWKIKVRLLKFWKVENSKDGFDFKGVEAILMDENVPCLLLYLFYYLIYIITYLKYAQYAQFVITMRFV